MTWPPRWDKPHFKTKTSRVAKRVKRAKEKTAEEKNKADVRRRDKRCRFPMCGCRKLKILPHVAHLEHKGMGGNPDGDRSAPEKMILVCACRHKENVVSIDRGTLECRPMTAKGTAGPVRWFVRTSELPTRLLVKGRVWSDWTLLGAESAIGKFTPIDGRSVDILRWLSSMEV